MNCPECNYPQYCPCESCQARGKTPEGEKPWIWIDGEFIKCAKCGFTAHADWWEDRDMRKFSEERRT